MKLPIKEKYFTLIANGEKSVELRSAHITFRCEETGETLFKRVVGVKLVDKSIAGAFPDVLQPGEDVIVFELG